MISFKKLFSSFKNAFSGLKTVFKEEQSFRIQIAIAFIVFIVMFILPLHYLERISLVLVICFVLGLELLNSQLERVCDLITKDYDLRIKRIKDLSAAAVLIASLDALLVGLFILLSHLL